MSKIKSLKFKLFVNILCRNLTCTESHHQVGTAQATHQQQYAKHSQSHGFPEVLSEEFLVKI